MDWCWTLGVPFQTIPRRPMEAETAQKPFSVENIKLCAGKIQLDLLNFETCLVRLSTTRRSVAKIARERTEGMRVDSVVSHKLPDPETRLIVTPLVRPRFFFRVSLLPVLDSLSTHLFLSIC